MTKTLILSFLLAGISFLSAQTTTEVTAEGSVLEKFALQSPSMGREIAVAVLLPSSYTKNTSSLPTLYALHGKKAPYLTFMNMPPLRRFVENHPMLVVSFDGGEDSCYIDATNRKNSYYTKFFFEELLPEIARRYRTNGQNAVTGFSMGGFGALHYVFTRPQAFTSASALSGAFTLFEDHGDNDRFAKWEAEIQGKREENLADYEAVALSARLKKIMETDTKLPPLLLMCGTGDFLKDANRQFIDRIHGLNMSQLKKHDLDFQTYAEKKENRAKIEEVEKNRFIDFEYRETNGGHDWWYWLQSIEAIAEFHWQHFSKK